MTRLEGMTRELNAIFGAPYGDVIAEEFRRVGKKRVWEKPSLLWEKGTDVPEQQDIVLSVMQSYRFAHPMTLPPSMRCIATSQR